MQLSVKRKRLPLFINEKSSDIPASKCAFRNILKKSRMTFFPLLFCYLELITHCFAYRSLNVNFIWVMLFSFGFGSIFTFITSVFSKRINAILTYSLTFVATLAFAVELVYFKIFKGFAPVSSLKMGTQAVTNFTGGMMEGIRRSVWWLVLLFVPFLLFCIFGILLRPGFRRPAKGFIIAPAVSSVVILAGTVGIMAMFFTGTPSLYKTFTSSSTSTDTSVNYFGLNATVVQEIRWMLFPDDTVPVTEEVSEEKSPDNSQTDSSVDFEALYDKAGDNETLKNITAELSNMPTTQKHEYTGLCEGYNLITICAEAFSPEFIDPVITPTLYKLSTNGFIFENFYSSYPNTTTNGEYSFCMGLFPDLSRGKTDSSFSVSAANYLPYCYGNIFTNMGKKAYAYHNYVAEFYYRNFTHPNMGYDFSAANSGLDIEITWPSSDYDMMVASVDDYIDSGEQFTAYYMTFSGHYQYTLSNAMSNKNWDKVESLPYSDAVKAYIACNLELEYALAYLTERLEAAGIDDKTVIVLTTDHFPYGLSDKQYAELAGRSINDIFDKQKNAFICYVPGLDEPVVVDSYCSTVDILPTVLNLFGFTYDSRLLAGHDILAPDAVHVAMLADGSFIADGVRFNSSLMRYQFENGSEETRETAEELYRLIEKRFRLSTEILNNNYYSYVYDKKSDSEVIDNLTKQYHDVEIMEQSSVYYILKNDIMDPISDTSFGLNRKCSVAEVLDAIYRIAKKPEIDLTTVDIPFIIPEKYIPAAAWAYANEILTDDGTLHYDLSDEIKLGQLALLLEKTAMYFDMDTSLDEESLMSIIAKYDHIDEPTIRALLFCRERNIIIGTGNEFYNFNNYNVYVDRATVTTSFYRLCSYYILTE